MFYWYSRLLAMEISNQDRVLALRSLISYYHTEIPNLTDRWGSVSHDMSKKKFGEKLHLQKQLFDLDPDDSSNLLEIGHTYKKLERYV